MREILESGQSRANTLLIVDMIGGDADRFRDLMKIFFTGDRRIAQCSSWPISVCAERHPHLLTPYLDRLVDRLNVKNDHTAVTRNIVRLLQYVDIPKTLQGKAYSHCLELIADPSQPVGVKAFAITVAKKIANAEPVLINEIKMVVKPFIKNASPGLKVRLRDLV
jgi:hypothetical protein